MKGICACLGPLLLAAMIGGCEEEAPDPFAYDPAGDLFAERRAEAAPDQEIRPVVSRAVPSPNATNRGAERWGSGGGGANGGPAPSVSEGAAQWALNREQAQEVSVTVAETQQPGNHACERAFHALRQQTSEAGEATGRRRRPPNRERFMVGCQALPEEMQNCLEPRYYRANEEVCNRTRRTYPPEMASNRPADSDAEEPP